MDFKTSSEQKKKQDGFFGLLDVFKEVSASFFKKEQA